jgi:phytoene desaturase
VKALVRRNLEGRRCVVVGGGVAGLAAAASLAARGARVRVLEASDLPGGRARRFTLGPFAFEPGPVMLTMPQVLGQLFAAADLRLTDFMTLRPVSPLVRIVFPDGERLDWHRDRGALAAEWERFAPEDVRPLEALLRELESSSRPFYDGFLAVPGGGRAPALARLADPRMRLAGRLALSQRSMEGWIARRFRSPRVAQAFGALALRQGVLPSQAPAGMLALVAADLHRGAWVPDGGMGALVAGLVRLCQLLEVRIVTGARVEGVEVENGEVRRVFGGGFRPLRTDLVVSAVDPRVTLRHFIPAGPARDKAVRGLASHAEGLSSLSLYLGTHAREDLLEAPETVFVSPTAREDARAVVRWRVAPADSGFVVRNATALHEALAPEGGRCLHVTAPMPRASDRYAWNEAHRDQWRERLLRRMAAAGADLSGIIEEERLLTPAEDGPGPGGAPLGRSIGCHSRAGLFARPGQRVPGVGGLYLAGLGAHPGVTAPGALLSGMLAAECASDDARSAR